MHATETTHTTDWERAAMKAHSDWCEVNVTHLMKVVEVMEMMEMVDKDKAHARANEYRRPPPPGIGIGIGCDHSTLPSGPCTICQVPSLCRHARPTTCCIVPSISACPTTARQFALSALSAGTGCSS
jgi:hypothetical protein